MTTMSATSEQFLVPEGHAKIAQRFNVGTPVHRAPVPKGRPKGLSTSVVPSGLNHFRTLIPRLKPWAIFACPSGTRKFIGSVVHSCRLNPSDIGHSCARQCWIIQRSLGQKLRGPGDFLGSLRTRMSVLRYSTRFFRHH